MQRSPAPPIDVFADAAHDDIHAALAGLAVQSCAPGDTIVERGDVADSFAVVTAGTLEVLGDDAARIALLGPGSIFGELALLRGRPRNATVRAVTEAEVRVGEREDFVRLCELPGVHRRLAEVIASRLVGLVKPIAIELRDGSPAMIRPLLPTDADRYDVERGDYSDATLYRRFASAPPSKERILRYLFSIDYIDHFAFVLARPGSGGTTAEGIGIGRYVRAASDPTRAEVALTVKDAVQGRGAGGLLLGALGAAALRAGITTLTADFLADNEAVAAMFKSAGGRVEQLGGGMAASSADATAIAARLPGSLGDQIGDAVAEVLSAAGLRP